MGRSDTAKNGRRELRQVRNRSLMYLKFGFVFSIFVNLLMLTGPLFMLQVYDRVLGGRSEETLLALFILVGGLFVLMGFLDFARSRVLARVGARFQTALDERVFKATVRFAPIPGSKQAPATAQQDLEAIQTFFASPALLALLDLPFTPFFFAAIYIFHPTLGWLAMAGGGFLIILTALNQFITRSKVRDSLLAQQQARQFSDNVRQANEVARAQGMLNDLTERWMARRIEALEQSMSTSDWTGSFSAFTKAFRLFLQSAILAVGAWLVLQGEMTAGAMIAASILLGRALAPVEQLLARWQVIQRARIGWTSLSHFLEGIPKDVSMTELPRPKAELEVKGLTVLPPEGGKPILRNISFKLEPGQVLGVIGKSGSGKTTLAKTLLGLWPPAAGEIRLGSATLGQYDPDQLGHYIGYLPQEAMLINGTVAENIARMALEPDAKAVVAAAQKARAHEVITGLEKGYDTMVTGNNVQLSGGQRQRVALARALYGDPLLLVLDEPNSALDADGTEALNAAVREMKNAGKTVIIMTHRPMAISECDTLMVVDKGQIAAFGPRDEVMRSMLKNADEVQQAVSQGGMS